MEPSHNVDVGERIKSLREDKRISLRLLAKRSGISANALSLIERGKTSPTVTTLLAVARAFSVPVHDFFSNGHKGKNFVVHRKGGSGQAGAIEAMATGLKDQNLNPILLRLGPHDTFRKDLVFHPGDEFVYCLSGEVECEIDSDRVRLNPGDAVTFKAEIPHRIQGVSRSGSDILVVFEVGRLG